MIHRLGLGVYLCIYPETRPARILVIRHGIAVTPSISIKYRCTPETIPVIIPTGAPNKIPPDNTAMIRTFTSEPSTLMPVYVPKMAKAQNNKVTAIDSCHLNFPFCRICLNLGTLDRKNKNIINSAARSNKPSSIVNISNLTSSTSI
ncbi:hypothetical protein D3C76_1377980 [compost metagenome]